MSKAPPNSYRPNVGIFVLNDEGKLLICERSDLANAWQIPQGGIDEREPLLDAMHRELSEEIGTAEVRLIAQFPGSIRYEWPESLYSRGYRGQDQFYFLVQLLENATIDLDSHSREFRSFEWIGASNFSSRVTGFKRDAYLQALEWFQLNYPGVIAHA